MKGIKKLAKDKYLVRVWLGYDPNGKQRFLNQTVYGSAKEAQRRYADLVTKKARREVVPAEKLTLGEFIADYLDNVARHRVRENTLRTYAEAIARHVPENLCRKRLQRLDMSDFERLYSQMADQGLSPETIRSVHAVLRVALRHAKYRRRIIAHDPTEGVVLPRRAGREMPALSRTEAGRLIAAVRDDHQCGVLLELILVLGLRPSEAIGLRTSDVDLDQGRLSVCQRIVWLRGGGFNIDAPKSRRSRRPLCLPSYMLPHLREQRRRVRELRLRAGSRWKDLDLLFTTGSGGPLRPNNISRRHFKPALARAELPPTLRLYDLRHAHATLLAAAGVPLRVVADQLGHANPYVTVTTYQHVTEDLVSAAADVFEGLFGDQETARPEGSTSTGT